MSALKIIFFCFGIFTQERVKKTPDKLILSSDSSYIERIPRFETTLIALRAKTALWIKDIKHLFKREVVKVAKR